MKLLLVRHGESVGNLENRLQGHADYELTELGRSQARLTALRLADMGVTALYTSPLKRAAETAAILGRHLGVAPAEVPGVSEYSFGELSGQTYSDVRQHFQAAGPGPQSAEARVYPGEEGRQEFFDRVTRAVWAIVGAHSAGEAGGAAIVSHGGPIALFCQTVLGLPYRRPMPFSIGNCSLTAVDADAERHSAVLTLLNDTRHLRGPESAAGYVT